jgi:tetratricopeptide (TPR) repeat protein
MRLVSRHAWVLAGAALLFLGIGLFAARDRGPSDPARVTSEVRRALKDGRWSRADTLLKRLAELRPPNADDVSLRAEMELGRGRPEESVRLLTSIPTSDPHAGRARLVAGQVEKSRGRARRAESLFLEATRLDPGLAAAHRELMLLYASQARRSDVNDRFRILERLEALSYEDALLWTTSFEDLWVNNTIRPPLERFVAADAEDRTSRLALAGVFVRNQQFEECEKLLSALPMADPDALALRARIALARTDLNEVRSLLEKAPDDHPTIAILRGQLANRLNQPAAAARLFRIALEQDPQHHEALLGLSIVLKQLGDAEAVAPIQAQLDRRHGMIVLLQKSRTFNIRGDKALLTQIGQACESLGLIPVARAWYRLALNQDPLDSGLQAALYRLKETTPGDTADPARAQRHSR